ncbi:two-component system VirA-like sensor kinase [Xanthomonas cerealis pv. cerealis]|nr:two-component system VirA-like sensor kinase [Xanthomonas translucens]UKE68436.1 two-component system VirA-like sensor kinase [Xanthomonas translucens pv. pistacia]
MKTVIAMSTILLVAMATVETVTRLLDERAHRYDLAMSTLDALNIADTCMHKGVLELRAGLLHDDDRIVDDDRHAWKALQQLPGLAQSDEPLIAAIRALERDYRSKSAQLELFKTQNALLGNSLAYFWRESDARMRDSLDRAELRRLGALGSAMHRLSMDNSADIQALARTRLEAATRGRGPSPLLVHGRMLLELLPATEASIERMRPVTELASYRRVRGDLQQRMLALDTLRATLRLCMLAMAAIMVAMLVHLTLLLRRRASTLRRRAEFGRIMVSISRELIGSDRARIDHAITAAAGRIAAWLDLPYSALILDGGAAPASIWPEPRDARVHAATAAALALPVAADGAPHDMAAVAGGGDAVPLPHPAGKRLRGAHWVYLRRHSGGGTAMLCLQRNERHGGFPRNSELFPLLYSALDMLAEAVIRRRLENEANALERRLEQARRMETIGAMASGISHNFNNIVGAIRANAEMALSALSPGAHARSHLVAIERATGHASNLIEAILDFGRAQKHNVQLVDLAALLRETQTLLRVSFSGAVRLDVRIDDRPLYVQGNASQLQQVILNLVHNAVRAMRRRGIVSIRLSVGTDQRTLRLSVADRGIGIPADRLERIFYPFYTTRAGGNGLGLATVKQIVGNHDGRIEVHSQVGTGTTFVIELPLCLPCTAQVQQPVQPSHRRLLLLCADRAALERLEEMLAALGHEPVGHLQAAAACRMLLDEPDRFDGLVVQCDDADAADQAIHALNAVAPQLPLLLIHAGQPPAAAARARSDYQMLRTPYSPGSLAQALERTLRAQAPAFSTTPKPL